MSEGMNDRFLISQSPSVAQRTTSLTFVTLGFENSSATDLSNRVSPADKTDEAFP